MARTYAFRLLNVFALPDPFTGNPLCVFEDAAGLSDAEMQSLALQFNLSETTFVLASTRASARVRIFTPGYEMPFAGHPTLGTAAVVSGLQANSPSLTLEMTAGIIPVGRDGERWQLKPNAPAYREHADLTSAVARFCGLEGTDVIDALFVDTGKEQLIAQVRSPECLRAAQPSMAQLSDALLADDNHVHLLLWTTLDAETIEARFFFEQGVSVLEDPATGSACANLGGRLLRDAHAALPRSVRVLQGAQTGRPSELRLSLSEAREIFVAGRVVELGRGTIELV